MATSAYAEYDVIELGQRLKHAKKEERRLAVRQLVELGPKAAPSVRQLTKAIGDEDDQVWLGATMALAAIGPKATHAIPRLVEEMSGGRARYAEQRSRRSAYALSKIGPASIPALVEALGDENEHRRWGALHALGLIGEPAHSQLPSILKRLGDDDSLVRDEAVETCAAFGAITLDDVGGLLESKSPDIRVSAAKVIQRLKEEAVAYRDQVRTALIEEKESAPRGALLETAMALEIDPEFLAPLISEALLGDEAEQDAAFQAVLAYPQVSVEMVPKLALFLSDKKATHRERAANLLGRLGESASSAASALVACLQTTSVPEERERCLNALILIGPTVLTEIVAVVKDEAPEAMTESHWGVRALKGLAPIALPELEVMLAEASPTVGCALLHALPSYHRRERQVEKHVRGWLSSENASLRAGAVTMLCRLPVPDKVWLAAERKALIDPAPEVRMSAITALAQVPVSKAERLKHLVAALEDDEPQVRRRSVEALGDMGGNAKEALQVLLASVQGPSPSLAYRTAVIQTFGKIGGEAKVAVPYLRSLLHDEMDNATCAQSLAALSAIGSKAKEAIPEILKLCEDEDVDLRRTAYEAFGKISDDSNRTIPVFLKALDDPSPEVRQPIMLGLGRLREGAAPAAGRLVDLLESEEDGKFALEALREIRPDDVDLCLRMLKSGNAGGRLLACDRLGRIKDRRALPDLRKALKDEHRYVRRRAQEAVSRIEDDKKKRK